TTPLENSTNSVSDPGALLNAGVRNRGKTLGDQRLHNLVTSGQERQFHCWPHFSQRRFLRGKLLNTQSSAFHNLGWQFLKKNVLRKKWERIFPHELCGKDTIAQHHNANETFGG